VEAVTDPKVCSALIRRTIACTAGDLRAEAGSFTLSAIALFMTPITDQLSTESRMQSSKSILTRCRRSSSVPRSLGFHTCSSSMLSIAASPPGLMAVDSCEWQPVTLDVSRSNPRRIDRLRLRAQPRYLENPVSSNCNFLGSD
jgi:hypothetical protein